MLDIIQEFVRVTLECLLAFLSDDAIALSKPGLGRVLRWLAVLLLSLLAGVGVHQCRQLWNRQRTPAKYWVLSAGTALATLLFITSFLSLNYLKAVSLNRIDHWQDTIQNDRAWGQETFRLSYYAIKKLGEEDFSNYPTPENGGNLTPASHESSRRKTGEVYVTRAIAEFKDSHPYLSLILKADLDVPEQKIYEAQNQFFAANQGKTYNLGGAIGIAATELKQGLERRIPPLITTTRVIISVSYGLFMFIIFAIIGFIAYRNIKVFR